MDDASPDHPAPARSRRTTWLLAAAIVLLAAAVAGLSWSRAGWVDRASEAERVSEDNADSAELWKQRANDAESDLRSSESTTDSLRDRQRELAAEKAKVEDDRAILRAQGAQLLALASAFQDAVLAYDTAGQSMRSCAVAIAQQGASDQAVAICERADSDLAAARSSVPQLPDLDSIGR